MISSRSRRHPIGRRVCNARNLASPAETALTILRLYDSLTLWPLPYPVGAFFCAQVSRAVSCTPAAKGKVPPLPAGLPRVAQRRPALIHTALAAATAEGSPGPGGGSSLGSRLWLYSYLGINRIKPSAKVRGTGERLASSLAAAACSISAGDRNGRITAVMATPRDQRRRSYHAAYDDFGLFAAPCV